MAKKIVLDKIAYEPHPVSLERKRELNKQGYKVLDIAFAPEGARHSKPKLRTDGPTVEQYVAAGYPAKNYPPHGYSSRSTSEEIAAAVSSQEASLAKIELGTDSADQFSDDQLRAAIEVATGEKVHHKTGREKLVARFNEINATNAVRQDETASNGLTRREIEADLVAMDVEFDPSDKLDDLAALRDLSREERAK